MEDVGVGSDAAAGALQHPGAGGQDFRLLQVVEAGAELEGAAGVVLILEVLPAASAFGGLLEGGDEREAIGAVVGAGDFGVGGAEEADPGDVERTSHVEEAGIYADHEVAPVEEARDAVEGGVDGGGGGACLGEGTLHGAIGAVAEKEGAVALLPEMGVELEPACDRPALDDHVGGGDEADHALGAQTVLGPKVRGVALCVRAQDEVGLALGGGDGQVKGGLKLFGEEVEGVEGAGDGGHLGGPVGAEVHPALPGIEEVDHEVEGAKLAVEHRPGHPGEKLLGQEGTEGNRHAPRLVVEAGRLDHVGGGVVDELLPVLGRGHGEVGLREATLERSQEGLHVYEVPYAVSEGDDQYRICSHLLPCSVRSGTRMGAW